MAGDELMLLDLQGEPGRQIFADFRDECRLVLARLKIQMTYSDIYGDEFPQVERRLDWFDRTLGHSPSSTKEPKQ